MTPPIAQRGETRKERAARYVAEGRCPYPVTHAPAPGDVGPDYSAACPCGKRVKVSLRGSYANHKPARLRRK